MATLNPHRDYEIEDQRLEKLEMQRLHTANCMLTRHSFVQNVLADELPAALVRTIAEQVGKITCTKDEEQIRNAYCAIGRALVDHLAECAWEDAR